MRNLRGTYVHRGDGRRRRRRIKLMLWAIGVIIPATFLYAHRKPASASAEPAMGDHSSSFFSIGGESRKLRQELESARGELSVARAKVERADKVIEFSSRYGITAGLAA